jgi:tetratricopeptide (TPR) repeat protein
MVDSARQIDATPLGFSTAPTQSGWLTRHRRDDGSIAPWLSPHVIIMTVLFLGALGIGYALLPGRAERIAMLERDGQTIPALAILEKSFKQGDRSVTTLYQLVGFYETFGQLDKSKEMLALLAEQAPRDVNVQRRLAAFYKQTQNEEGYVRTLKLQIETKYEEKTCRELIGIHRRAGQYADEQAALQLCRLKGYRKSEDIVRLAALLATDGDHAQASTLLRSVDDLRRLKNERERLQLFDALIATDQPREALRRATRWLRGQRDSSFALTLIEILAIDKRQDLAIELAKDIGAPGDSISLAIAELMLGRGQTVAARSYLRGWIEKVRFDSPEMVTRFIVAALDAEDPENALAGARKVGLTALSQNNLVAIAEALAVVGKQADFDAVKAIIQPEVLAENPLLGAAVALQKGGREATQQLLAKVQVDDLDEWRLSLWARLMDKTGRGEAASATLQQMGVEASDRMQVVLAPDRTAAPGRIIRRVKQRLPPVKRPPKQPPPARLPGTIAIPRPAAKTPSTATPAPFNPATAFKNGG